MGLIEDIALLGADTEDGLTRCMGKPELYERMLKKLPKAVEEAQVMPFVESGDIDTALSNVHTLKGVVGNLSLIPLYNNYVEITSLLRDSKLEKATELLAETLKIQQSIVDCIKKYE